MHTQAQTGMSGRHVHTSGLWQARFTCATIVHTCVPAKVHTLSGGVYVQSSAQCFLVFYMLQLCKYRYLCQFSHMHRKCTCMVYTHVWGLCSHVYMHIDIHFVDLHTSLGFGQAYTHNLRKYILQFYIHGQHGACLSTF